MIIAIGGQLNKNEIKSYIDQHAPTNVSCIVCTDMDAAMRVKTGECDYYVGACQSGAGGALAMAYAILGQEKCATIGMPGIAPKEECVADGFKRGCKAFGFTNEQVEAAMSLVLKNLPEE